jgi:hypothetical protein
MKRGYIILIIGISLEGFSILVTIISIALNPHCGFDRCGFTFFIPNVDALFHILELPFFFLEFMGIIIMLIGIGILLWDRKKNAKSVKSSS